jgi:hypothetical protein
MTEPDGPASEPPAVTLPTDAIICLAECWACLCRQHYDEPVLHIWWDEDDVEHARNTGQEPPTGWCGCGTCGAPAVAQAENGR